MIHTDICIIGAGPGGVATALKLSYMNIPSVLIDKAVFPRDKICGDAIGAKVPFLLNQLDPSIMQRFLDAQIQVGIWGTKYVAPNFNVLDISFKPEFGHENEPAPASISTRLAFDNFLIEEVRRRPNIRFIESVNMDTYEKVEDGFIVSDSKGNFRANAKILIVSNGAHSEFARKYAGLKKETKHYAGAVRAYYENVKGLGECDSMELHFFKEFVPGYFWIFPLPDNRVNVGIGLRTDLIKKRKVNLKKKLLDVITNHKIIAPRFEHARLISDIEGFGLPLGSKKRPISGDNFMLVGDAAHLIDPLTGEGIGNAFYSGFIAADQAKECLRKQRYSSSFMRKYDKRVQRTLGAEMKLSYLIQKMLGYPFIANTIANNKWFVNMLTNLYSDFELRKKLSEPFSFLKRIAFWK